MSISYYWMLEKYTRLTSARKPLRHMFSVALQMQATVLSWLLMHRDDLTCEGTTSGKSGLRCSKTGSNGEDGGEGLLKRPDLTLSVDYVKVRVERRGFPHATVTQQYRVVIARNSC